MAEVDTSSYRNNVVQSPLDTASKVLDIDNKLLQNAQGGQQIQANQIKLATDRFGMINNAASGLLEDPDLGKKDVTGKLWDVMGRLTKGDTMSAAHAVQFMQQFPTDPTEQAQAIKAVHAQTLDAWQKGQAYLGINKPQDVGGGIVMGRQGDFSNAPPVNTGYVAKTVAPGTPKIITDPNSPEFGRETATGGTGPTQWQPPPNQLQPRAPVQLQSSGGVMPATPIAPARQKVGPTPTVMGDDEGIAKGIYPNPNGPRPVVTKLAPGELASQEASRVAYSKDLIDNKTYLERTNPLRMAIPLLEKLGTTGTGPGKETVNHIKSFAQSFGIPIPNADDLTSFAKAKKYLEQNATSIAPPGTNVPSVLAAFESNPNIQQPNAAASELAKNMYALARMNRAALLAFKDTGLPTSQYADWATKWSRTQDVRGYMADLMSPEDRAKMSKSIKPGTVLADRIKNAVDTADKFDLFGDVEGHDVKSKPKKAAP